MACGLSINTIIFFERSHAHHQQHSSEALIHNRKSLLLSKHQPPRFTQGTQPTTKNNNNKNMSWGADSFPCPNQITFIFGTRPQKRTTQWSAFDSCHIMRPLKFAIAIVCVCVHIISSLDAFYRLHIEQSWAKMCLLLFSVKSLFWVLFVVYKLLFPHALAIFNQ